MNPPNNSIGAKEQGILLDVVSDVEGSLRTGVRGIPLNSLYLISIDI